MDKGPDAYLTDNWNTLTADMRGQRMVFLDRLVKQYSSPKRYYHNLQHIKALLLLLDEHRHLLTDPQTVQFGIWYHDVVYNVLTSTNELESAKLARQHLFAMGYPANKINRCFDMIVATKTHQLPPQVDDIDGRFFMDIDLSILGADKEQYLEYAEQVRNEYKVFPSFLYRRGRKKALQHLLDTPSIYKTDLFRDKLEAKARANLQMELSYL